jgi:metal-responsive CopG/Arc/MetJ family transcriptional regulator
MPAVTRSFSAPDDLLEKADARKVELGFENFSDYVKSLIRKDVEKSQTLRETPPPYRVSERARKQ